METQEKYDNVGKKLNTKLRLKISTYENRDMILKTKLRIKIRMTT